MIHTIGIDPGVTGALAILDHDGQLLQAIRTPTIKAKGRTQYDINAMMDALHQHQHQHQDQHLRAGIELVHTLPRDGRVGAFNFGRGLGLWLGLLSGLQIPYTEVTPQRWQASMLAGLPRGPHSKTSAVRAAKALFPNIPINAKADWGLADAALIAEFTRRLNQGKT